MMIGSDLMIRPIANFYHFITMLMLKKKHPWNCQKFDSSSYSATWRVQSTLAPPSRSIMPSLAVSSFEPSPGLQHSARRMRQLPERRGDTQEGSETGSGAPIPAFMVCLACIGAAMRPLQCTHTSVAGSAAY